MTYAQDATYLRNCARVGAIPSDLDYADYRQELLIEALGQDEPDGLDDEGL